MHQEYHDEKLRQGLVAQTPVHHSRDAHLL